MSRDTPSQTPQQSVAEGSKEKTAYTPEEGSSSNSNSAANAAATSTTKKGRALLHVPSRSSSQKIQPSPTSTGLSGATASDSRDSIGRQSRESKNSFLGRHRNGSVSSKHSGNVTGPTNTPGNSQPSSPAVATNAHQKRKKGGGGFLAIFGCCTVPEDANALDVDGQLPPANKLKDIPPRPATASRRTATPNDEISAAGRAPLNEKDEHRQETIADEPLLQTRQPEQQYMPSGRAPQQGSTATAVASSSKEKRSSGATSVQDQSSSTAASTAVAGTSTLGDSDSKRASLTGGAAASAPIVTVDPPSHQEEEAHSAEDNATAAAAAAGESSQQQDGEQAGENGADDDVEMQDAGVATASARSAQVLTQVPEVLPNVPPPPPGPAPTGALPQVENHNGNNIAELIEQHRQKALLPPIEPHLKGRKCLVLDLDETLVHSSFKVGTALKC